MNTKKTLYIFDEQLKNIDGHNFEYIKCVKEIVEAKGYSVKIYANKKVISAIQATINAIPYFDFNDKPWYRKLPVLGAIIYRLMFWQNLRSQYQKVINALDNLDSIEIFVPNIYWYNVLPISAALKNIKFKSSILFRNSVVELTDAPSLFHPVIKSIFVQTAQIVNKNSNIHLVTDSKVIADEWEMIYKTPMKVLPIPHVKEMATVNVIPSEKLLFYAPGVMRLEKGMELIYRTIEYIDANNIPLAQTIKLALQIFGQKDKEIFDIYREKLKALKNVEVEILGSLTSHEYQEQIARANVILIPYVVGAGYRARTSGVLCEAIGATKPFITTANTWMSQQAAQYNTGIIIRDGNQDDLIDAIVEVKNNYEKYLQQAQNAKSIFLQFHSTQTFYEILC